MDETAEQRIAQLEEALQAAEEELRFFVYAAGHDLQQPLRTVSTHAQLLQRVCTENDRAREITDTIIAAAGQMNTLISALVTYSRQNKSGERRYIPLQMPLDAAIYKLAGSIQVANAEIRKSELPEVLADEQQMTMLFEHLLSNALKYHGAHPPSIQISGETSGDFHEIAVRDNGCGIAPEYHEHVFLPFKRLHGRDIPGTGLGLSLCRKIVQFHDGRIWLESDGQQGTTVRFTLAA